MAKVRPSVKLALLVQDDFDVVVWRSLQNAPSVEDKLTDILQFLLWSLRKEMVIPDSFDGKLSKLMECLSSNQCLIILDNAETILSSGGRAGTWRPGYERYGQLIKTVSEAPHNSCILLTSREKPVEIAFLEGETKIKSQQLSGLKETEARELFQQKGQFAGTQQEWKAIVEHYGGNPLALKMVAAGTQELFNGSIARVLEYVEQGSLIFDDIRDLLECQFQRLSAVEQEIIYWLAINRESISLNYLSSDIVTPMSRRLVPSAVKSLLQRSLIEKSGDKFFLQPVVMEYVSIRLWDAKLGQCFKALQGISKSVRSVALSPDGLIVASACNDYCIRLWNVDNGECVNELQGHTRGVLTISYAPIDKQLASSGPDNTVRVWDTQSGEALKVLHGHTNLVWAVSWSPDGRQIASSSDDCTIRLWDAQTGEVLRILQGHTDWVTAISYLPSNINNISYEQLLASCSYDHSIRLWNSRTGDCLKVLQYDETYLLDGLSFAPNSCILATGASNGSIYLWDVEQEECIKSLNAHTQSVRSVSWSPDGQIERRWKSR